MIPTWKELKDRIEGLGVKDETKIKMIDIWFNEKKICGLEIDDEIIIKWTKKNEALIE